MCVITPSVAPLTPPAFKTVVRVVLNTVLSVLSLKTIGWLYSTVELLGVLSNDYHEFDGLIRVRSGGAVRLVRSTSSGFT
ncbi:hypothetical protein HVA01_15330 [Halovibrio variabilis]|uniref:Uncharacterized protein n=1 Tax=Halovibrio variabilis TaxID=31910 RepID=A0A511UMT7_9GAMM|nr:hypothetical protein HVA01_15330 [Halovibrio variabilis]